MDKEAVNSIVDAFGGVAELCEKLSWEDRPLRPGSIYKWRNTGRIPELWAWRLNEAAAKYGVDLNQETLKRAVGLKQDTAA